jgi:hypothetical protein
MTALSTSRRRAAIVMVAASVAVLGVIAPASAGPTASDSSADDWGTVVPNGGCAQADSWIASIRGLGGDVDARLFESHSPSIPKAPQERNGGKDLVNLTVPSLFGTQAGIGVASALYTRALTNKLPANPGGQDTQPGFCTASAEAGAASVDIGLPYIGSPIPDAPQLSPVGLHLEGISVDATAAPGKAVTLHSGVARGYISALGLPLVTLPAVAPANFGLRIPEDRAQPVVALATTNEQVTTDSNGRPTLDPAGHYALDPTASSGYVNAVHVSVLGTNVADIVVGHAAVLTGFPETGVPGVSGAPVS